MLAATVYKLYQFYGDGYSFGSHEWTPLILGNVVAFIIAIFAMRSFVQFLTRNGFRLFGWYRIIIGSAILLMLALGVDLQIV